MMADARAAIFALVLCAGNLASATNALDATIFGRHILKSGDTMTGQLRGPVGTETNSYVNRTQMTLSNDADRAYADTQDKLGYWTPTVIPSSTNIVLSVTNNLYSLVLEHSTCVLHPPAVDTNRTQSFRLELVAGTNAVTFNPAVSNAANISISTTVTTPLLFDQPYKQTYWKVYDL